MLARVHRILILVACVVPILHAREADDPDREIDWTVIDFTGGRDGQRLKKVRIIIKEGAGFGFDFTPGRIVADVVIDDKKSLERLESAFNQSLLHPPRKHQGASGLSAFGKLEVETTETKFNIYFSREFCLKEETPSTDNTFWSYGLAKEIQKALKEKSKHKLPEYVVDRLAGEELREQLIKEFGE